MGSEHKDWYKLTEELVKLARRELRNAFLRAGDDDERLKYPTLAREVRRVIDDDERWTWSPKQAVIDVIWIVFKDIPETLTGRNYELRHQADGDNAWKGKPEREIAEFLYGYRDQELPASKLLNGAFVPHTYKGSYLQKAYELLGYSGANRDTSRALRVIRQDMAAAILDLKPNDPRLPPFVQPSAPMPTTEAEPSAAVTNDDSIDRSPSRTVSDLDPFDLGVHHPIVIDGDVAESALPPYAERRHDHQLRELLTDVTKSLMVVLTGGSSTGKTRTAWEAVTACLPDWQLHIPTSLGDLDRLIEQQTDQSQTVVWLDEAQDTLQADPTAIPRAFRALLTAPGRVVVLATMWTDPYWQWFTTEPARGEPDPWRQLRALLFDSRRVTRIRVPESFTDEPEALDTLRSLAQTDGRLAEAIDTASDGKVIQTLSGGTLLVDRYQDAADTRRHAWAVITAAIDACRLGHDRRLPAGVLEDGAIGYLTEDTDRVGDDDWFTAALRHATQEVRGVAVFRPARVSGGVGSADSYILDDYVLQHGQQVRKYEPASESLWDALIEHVEDYASRRRLVGAAEHRHMRGVAVSLALPFADEGHAWFLYKLIELLERTGMAEELKELRQALGSLADPAAIREQGVALKESGNLWEAEGWLVQACVAGDTTAMTMMAEQEEARGEIDGAAAYLQWRAQRLPYLALEKGGDRRYSPYWDMVTLFCRAGRLEEAEEFWREAIRFDGHFIDLLGPDGASKIDPDVPHEREWLLRAIAERVVGLDFLFQLGDERAEEILRSVVALDAPASPFAMEELAGLLERAGKSDTAAEWLQSAAEAGSPSAMRLQAERLEADGSESDADEWWRRAAREGDEEAIWHLMQRYASGGRLQEVDDSAPLALHGDDSAASIGLAYGIAMRLHKAKLTGAAESLLRSAAGTGNPLALARLGNFLMATGSPQEAEQLLRRAILVDGNSFAYQSLCFLLVEKDADEADRLVRFGLEPDGKTGEPWSGDQ